MVEANAAQWSGYGPVGRLVKLSIELECSAIKAGNVHPHAGFHDLSHSDFLLAADSIGQAMDATVSERLGVMVLRCVDAMMTSAKTNTSLGTILLLAPLAKSLLHVTHQIHRKVTWIDSLHAVLGELSDRDSTDIYQAIRLAKPGGLGQSEEMDIAGPAPLSIMDAMRVASSRDDVALQYATRFELVFEIGKRLSIYRQTGAHWLDCIRRMQIELLSERRDSLIARNQGVHIADRVKDEAASVIIAGAYGSPQFEAAWAQFDGYLRDELHQRNPGTVADLLAAGIFVCLANESESIEA
jgi:triphosphoribosyl-dephospho-CoA synthase